MLDGADMQDYSDDTLLGGRVLLRQPRAGYRAAIDPVLLAAFCPAEAGQAVCEFGGGTGAALLCLAARVPGLSLTALEPDATMRNYLTHNAAANSAVVEIVAGAVGAQWVLPEGAYDHVIFNPPFFEAGTYSLSPYDTRNQAHALTVGLEAWAKAARRALKPQGQVAMILHAAQMAEALGALQKGFGAVEVMAVRPKVGENASRVLIRAKLGRKTPLAILPDLVLHAADGSYSKAAQALLRDGESL